MIVPSAGFIKEWHQSLEPYSEAPSASWLGGGIALLSACLGPQLRTRFVGEIDPGVTTHREFGHVWVMILGPSAAARKSTVSSTVRSAIRIIIDRAGINAERRLRVRQMPAGRISDAGLVRMLSADDDEEAQDWWSKGPPGFLLDASEVASLFGSANGRPDSYTANARTVLLRAYDGEVSSETVETKVPHSPSSPTIFANATKAGLEERLRNETVSSGFYSRWVPIEAAPSGKAFSIPTRHNAGKALAPWWGLIADAMKNGGVVPDSWELYTPDARKIRDNWYCPLVIRLEREAYQGAEDGDSVPELRLQVVGRWQVTAHKLAVLHAVSQQLGAVEKLSEIVVDAEDVTWGIMAIESALEMTDKLIEGAERRPSRHREDEDKIVRHLRKSGGMLTRNEIRQKTGMSSEEVDLKVAGSELLGEVKVPTKGRPAQVVFLAEELDEQAVLKRKTKGDGE